MSSLLNLLRRRSPQRLPSYAPSDTPSRRTPLSKLIYAATCIGFGYCTVSLLSHYVINVSGSEGESMVPTIASAHSLSIHSPQYKHGKGVRLGDIVHAKNPVLAKRLVGKRVVGMPGDYVVLDASQAPTVGGAVVPGIWDGDQAGREEPMMVQVPEGHVWLAGDNMSRSRDSRFYGAVPLAMIESKVLYNGDGVFSWNSFRKEQLRPVEMVKEDEDEVKIVKTDNGGVD